MEEFDEMQRFGRNAFLNEAFENLVEGIEKMDRGHSFLKQILEDKVVDDVDFQSLDHA